MSSIEDRRLDNLVRDSEALIRGVETYAEATAAAQDQIMDADVDVQAEPDAFAEPSTDGTALIDVSRDEMVAVASFHPPLGGGVPLTLEAVTFAIEEKGIAYGVDWDALKGLILTCNEERTDVTDVVIARGKAPVSACAPYLVLSEKLVAPPKKEETEGSRVDFKELSLFTLVRKGEELAVLQPKRDGAMGTSVRGKAVPFQNQKIAFPRPGKNTELRNATVVAQCAGRFQVNADSFWVDEVLDIIGDIDLRVGNIDFPGDVVVHGEIRDGFVVKAGKSLLCTGCIGAARVACGGDLVTQQGIVGKNKAVILVGGTAEAKFLEGCVLDAGGPVRVRTSVLNATIHTKDRVEMGDRGIIIGGVIKAQNGISAEQIGTERGPRTEIHCGIDFKVQQKLVWIRDRNIALAFKLREVEAKMQSGARAQEVLAPLHARIKSAIHQLNENARSLVSGLDRNESADVSVRGTLYPGTYVEICHVSHFITRPRRMVSLRLDKANGKIAETKWEKPESVRKPAAPDSPPRGEERR